MHIVCVTRSLPVHRLGGMEAVAWDLCQSLAKRGVRVTVLTTATEGSAPRSTIEGVEIMALDAPAGRYSAGWWKASVAAFRTYADCDAVLSVSIAAVAIAQDKQVRSRTKARFFMQCHGTVMTDLRSKLRTGSLIEYTKAIRLLPAFIKDFRYRAFDAIVAVGPTILADLRKFPMKTIIGDTPVLRIDNGIDEEQFRFLPDARDKLRSDWRIPPDAIVGVCAGRLHEQKGVQNALRALAVVRQRGVSAHLVVAGGGDYQKELIRLTGELGLADRVRFLGETDRGLLPAIYSAADVLLFPTLRIEGFGMVTAEALACGLPAIVSSNAVLPDQPGQIGVDPRDIPVLAEAIMGLRPADESRHSKLSPRYSLASNTDAYLSLFRSGYR